MSTGEKGVEREGMGREGVGIVLDESWSHKIAHRTTLLTMRSTTTLHELMHGSGVWRGVAEFTGFVDGADATGVDGPGREAKEEISDRVRLLSEQCDGLQGELWEEDSRAMSLKKADEETPKEDGNTFHLFA